MVFINQHHNIPQKINHPFLTTTQLPPQNIINHFNITKSNTVKYLTKNDHHKCLTIRQSIKAR